MINEHNLNGFNNYLYQEIVYLRKVIVTLNNKVNILENKTDYLEGMDSDLWDFTCRLEADIQQLQKAAITLTTVDRNLIGIVRQIVPNDDEIINELNKTLERLNLRD